MKTMRGWAMVTIMGAMAIGVSIGGCSSIDPNADVWESWPDTTYVETPLLVDATQHAGTIGAVREFDGEIFMASGYSYEDWATIEVRSQNRAAGWAAMSVLHISGDLADPALQPGARLTFQNDYERGYDGASLFIDVVGCSGPEDNQWEDDIPAEEVTVTVHEGATPEQRVLHFEATFPDGMGQVEGEVSYELR